ncbi:hypothetical protein Sipo8835_03445 [Streptomyces ipomoeae]|uniref:Uncharacterized protein n=2 Tax=Streptomyces ipomoeae TaxID=103232 RepID=L1KY68_9ACTN|nr:hypothetical protein [Streptomyces ipomoeae]EKX65761.1 hypothetical protein STRIP9103_03812 [Streptomyces ipomoeae 91-03]MDX2694020.1 hypothetical protein [Streptomyces ipomoeae]MDX2840423.1 hypothetical protein [Streptomyces ipomoeae]TQE31247.1 hypothetical protein Sipo7851_25835 [Streptomyces ipomoeae]TQE38946.1 hypothetical protein Sipo8835_03445 [Streptomyces ipomoeae]
MHLWIRRLMDWARAFIAPAGRHRIGRLPSPSPPSPPHPVHRPLIAPTVQPWYEPIDGASTRLVRPYLAAHEREEKARIQRLRRDTLWCATYGVDLDNRDIHAWLEAV